MRAKFGTPLAAIGLAIWLLREILGMCTDIKEFNELFPGAVNWLGAPWFGPVVFIIGVCLYLWAHHDWKKGRNFFDSLYADYGVRYPKMSLVVVCLIGALVGAVASGKAWTYLAKRQEIQTASNNDRQQQDAKPADTNQKKKDENKKKDGVETRAGKDNDTHKAAPKDAGKPNASPPVPAQQPTYSVNNPSGSIINQGSRVDAPQTVINGPAPRQVTNPDTLTASLRKIAKSSNEPAIVLIVMTDPDQESKSFRDALAAAFQEAEWKVTRNNSRNNLAFMGEAFIQGLLCSGETETTLNAVADALEASGIKCSERKKSTAPSNQAFPVWLAIGKPE